MSIQKPKVHLKLQPEEKGAEDENLSGIKLLSFIFEDFFKVSYGVAMIYIDAVLVAYPFTFIGQYRNNATIFSILYTYQSNYSEVVIPLIIIVEIILIIFERRLYFRIWSRKNSSK